MKATGSKHRVSNMRNWSSVPANRADTLLQRQEKFFSEFWNKLNKARCTIAEACESFITWITGNTVVRMKYWWHHNMKMRWMVWFSSWVYYSNLIGTSGLCCCEQREFSTAPVCWCIMWYVEVSRKIVTLFLFRGCLFFFFFLRGILAVCPVPQLCLLWVNLVSKVKHRARLPGR